MSLIYRLLLCWGMALSASGQTVYSGKVLADGRPLKGVAVTDGRSVVLTSQDGGYSLTSEKTPRFLTVTVPDGFAADSFFRAVRPGVTNYSFGLKAIPRKKNISFLHIADTETAEYGDWIDNLKAYNRDNRPDFLMHTGDICYEPGLRFHAKNVTTATMGLPVYYGIGNHDLLKGSYGGEWLYEELFGPVMYSFEKGNVHFVVAPMLSGDHRPSYTPEDVVRWIKADLAVIPKGKPVIIFSHDLWSDGKKLELKAKDGSSVNFLDYNTKAFIYGHWHINHVYPIPGTNVLTICASTPDKGGIDHSPSVFQVFDVDTQGNIRMENRYSYAADQLTLVSPMPGMTNRSANLLSVNAYQTNSPYASLRAEIVRNGKPAGKVVLKQQSSWNWQATLPSALAPGDYSVRLSGTLKNGAKVNRGSTFSIQSDNEQVSSGEWKGLRGNAAHDALPNQPTGAWRHLWTAHAGGETFMTSPVVRNGYLVTATIDDSNLEKQGIVGFDLQTGREAWRFKTENSVKNSLTVDGNAVIATDSYGITYALNIADGKLLWKSASSMGFLPAFVSGICSENGVVFTGMGNGLKALKTSDGAEIWKGGGWHGGEGTSSTLTVGDGVLVSSAHWRGLYGNDAATGKLLWKHEDNSLRFRDGSATYQGGLFHLFSTETYYALSPKTGEIVRQFKLPVHFHAASAPIVVDNLLLTGSSDGGLVAIEASTGKITWQAATGAPLFYTVPYNKKKEASVEASPVVTGKTVLFGASDGYFYAVSLADGHIIQKINLGAPVFSTPAVVGKQVYVSDFSGNVHAFSVE
ncbi:outer membrane protein assembly factor BamB family protein [Siphonobacter aquaeclarae]|uniref:Outer membrane protein assembly factor BamB, contains PQQ-like beta-propeller repeat n=1 Tax=Siphonobacter aquaeclarae TaxID=563176 RepID=A0A1G9I9S2_9BACT|nr:PQQ-binding-like beta-propeller repeat protein [Siphonobacter aquaeclarae]SDL21603.1 Outer membrane protein assembly factor BamB, contains PQQ-like beta-propeller repeat [Siphonobacter aquaeclarae]